MAIKLGNNDISFKVGNSDVDAIYLGSTLVYSGGTPPTPTFQGKWLATYTGGTTSSADCDASSAITRNDEINRGYLESLEIGNCVSSIGYGALSDCPSLASIVIPDSVTIIGDGAFAGCGSLTSCTIGSGVISIGYEAFVACNSLTSCTIGSGVTTIGDSAFEDCNSLTSITVNATTPPTLGFWVFRSTNDYPIYVPAGSVNAYKAASGWGMYADRIQAMPNS